MSTHHNYFEIEADSYFELGLRKGDLFGGYLRAALAERKRDARWKSNLRRARSYHGVASQCFPQLTDELKGYAEGAGVSFEDLWLLSVEDEFDESAAEKCTTVVTNGGSLIIHNEDWDSSAATAVCVLRKTIGDLSVFELSYFTTLGGNSISINSHGFVHAINSLNHVDRQVGVPKNFVARWLSETRTPGCDFEALANLQRASGYHHCVVGLGGDLWSMECSATRHALTKPDSPFVHTNHYLSSLSALESEDRIRSTRRRYRCAWANVRDPMSVADAMRLASDTSAGSKKSIFNNRTIARMIIDLPQRAAYVWLRREAAAGWVTYAFDRTSKK